jgi:hypothetical protein
MTCSFYLLAHWPIDVLLFAMMSLTVDAWKSHPALV